MALKQASLLAYLGFIGIALSYNTVKVTYPHFEDLPLTTQIAATDTKTKFMKIGHDDELNADVYSYPNDPRFMILYDSEGIIAGNRACYIKSEIGLRAKWNNVKYNYLFDEIPTYTSRNYWNTDVWCHDVLYQSPEVLKKGGRGTVEYDEIWLKLTSKEFVQIPTDECEMEPMGFTLTNCYYGMGKHFFYNLSKHLNCSTWNSVVTMFEYGKMTSIAWAVPGQFSYHERNWFENATKQVVMEIQGDGNVPQCFLDAADQVGVIDLHIMFHPDPLNIQCMWPWQIDDQCTWR